MMDTERADDESHIEQLPPALSQWERRRGLDLDRQLSVSSKPEMIGHSHAHTHTHPHTHTPTPINVTTNVDYTHSYRHIY